MTFLVIAATTKNNCCNKQHQPLKFNVALKLAFCLDIIAVAALVLVAHRYPLKTAIIATASYTGIPIIYLVVDSLFKCFQTCCCKKPPEQQKELEPAKPKKALLPA